MILRVIVLFILKILDVIANAIAWLLVAFGLWIPAIYVIVFVIACAVMSVNLSTVGGIFWLGLALSVVLGVLVALRGIKKDLRKTRGDSLPDKPSRSNISKVNRRDMSDVRTPTARHEVDEQDNQSQEDTERYAKQHRQNDENYSTKPREKDKTVDNYEKQGAKNSSNYTSYEEEQPRIFATKRDKNVFVYEYSDRIEVYEKSWRGMEHVYTESKNK